MQTLAAEVLGRFAQMCRTQQCRQRHTDTRRLQFSAPSTLWRTSANQFRPADLQVRLVGLDPDEDHFLGGRRRRPARLAIAVAHRSAAAGPPAGRNIPADCWPTTIVVATIERRQSKSAEAGGDGFHAKSSPSTQSFHSNQPPKTSSRKITRPFRLSAVEVREIHPGLTISPVARRMTAGESFGGRNCRERQSAAKVAVRRPPPMLSSRVRPFALPIPASKPPCPSALIGLGSNQGDRQAALEAAVAELGRQPQIAHRRGSAWRETAPVGGPPGQARFLNGALRAETSLGPARHCWPVSQQIENRLGRRRDRALGTADHRPRSAALR